jgi:NADPH:quinone reductase-like Zn-dependent oxidoreductase
MTELTVGASSSQTQMRVATPDTVPNVDTTTTPDAAGMVGSVAEAAGVVHNIGNEVPEVSPSVGVAFAGGEATMTGDGDELVVVMGHPSLRAPGQVSLSEAMATAHFALCQA